MYDIETRKVSDAVWWNPFTWGKSHQEQRRVWDMFGRVRPCELKLFIHDDPNYESGIGPWETIHQQ
jgi:hypothetical protein